MTSERRGCIRWIPALLCVVGLYSLLPEICSAQAPEAIAVLSPNGEAVSLAVHDDRGFPAVLSTSMEALGWVVDDYGSGGDGVVLRHPAGREMRLSTGSPLLGWDGQSVQMVDAPYRVDGEFYIPLQVAVDLLPGLLPQGYRFEADASAILIGAADPEMTADSGSPEPPVAAVEEERDLGGAAPPDPFTPEGGEYERLVVIDPGHGGDDPGAIGPDGEEEKDLALAISLALAQELARRPGVEVRLTRDRDVTVPVWVRGEWATEWRSDRPAVFLSIHANALPDRTGVRGFETYFLSEARTEHERRVAAAENSVALAESGTLDVNDPFLDEILRDLRAYDHQEWSALLAQEIQTALGEFHPGPDRGIKQGPLAVITNSLMPSVLIEIGFISNREEARAMEGIAFRREAAESMALAVDRFFERYYPAPEAPTF